MKLNNFKILALFSRCTYFDVGLATVQEDEQMPHQRAAYPGHVNCDRILNRWRVIKDFPGIEGNKILKIFFL